MPTCFVRLVSSELIALFSTYGAKPCYDNFGLWWKVRKLQQQIIATLEGPL